MFSFLKSPKIKDSQFILIFDLSSGGLQSHILEKKINTPTRIINNGFLPSPYFGSNEAFDNSKTIEELFTRSINRLNEKYNLDWDQIYCILPTHLLKNDPNILRHAPGIKSRFDKDLIFKIANNQKNKHLKKYSTDNNTVNLIDDVILKITLDGEDLDHINNICEGDELCVHHFISSAETKLIDNIKSTIARYLKTNKPIFFYSRPLSIFKTLISADHFNSPQSMIIDTSGNTTDIMTIKNNTIHQIGWIPVGKNTITRQVAEKTNTSFHNLNSELQLISENLVKANTNLKNALEDALNEWSYQLLDITGVENSNLPIGILVDDNISLLLSDHIKNRLTEDRIFIIDKEWLGLPATENKSEIGPFITSLFVDKYL